MNEELPIVYRPRHGDTAWSVMGQHTGLADLPLTERGEQGARSLGNRLQGVTSTKVFTCPLRRARRMCELAGCGDIAEIDPDLVEWNYGGYGGRKTEHIRAERPDWRLFRDGCPNGESPQQVVARADCVIGRVRSVNADVGFFHWSLRHRWLGLGAVPQR